MEKRAHAAYLFFLTIIVGISYQFLAFLPIHQSLTLFIGTIWNASWAGLAGYCLLRSDFLSQFKHFSFKKLLWGFPLTLLAGVGCSYLYTWLVGPATSNSIGAVISIQMILLQVPFMLLGEELLSTNILLALEKRGLPFIWASIICSVLFALWHIPAYGFHPLQLIITLMPTRLALNYVWKKSNSVWVSLACHFLYDCLGFIQYFMK